jgi:hypothetical protein
LGLFSRNKKPRISLQQMLASRPVRLVEGDATVAGEGKWRLAVPLKPRRWAGWFLRVPAGTTKTFELDPLGKLVWDACDGKTSVQQVIKRLAKQYNLNVREAQVATLTFLQTLVRKGLVGMPVRDGKGDKKGK